MGYYVAVPCRSVAAREKMRAFLQEHFRRAHEVMDWLPDSTRMGMPENGKDICAYAKANDFGWYRNAGWDYEHRHYASCLLRWMAMKIGRKMVVREGEIPNYGRLTVHFTIYDDPYPFVTTSQCPDLDPWDAEGYEVCDGLGWNASMKGPLPGDDPEWDAECSPHVLGIRKRKAKGDPLIRAELERLEELWNA